MKPFVSSSLRLLRLFGAPFPVAFIASARADFVYTQTFTVNQTIPDFGELASAPVLSGLSGLITDVNVGLVLLAALATTTGPLAILPAGTAVAALLWQFQRLSPRS